MGTCLSIVQRASEARGAINDALRIASRRFEELGDEEIWALRYQLIVLVEALASMCIKFARATWGRVFTSYRECLREVDRRLGTGCGEALAALVGLRNLLVHRYFAVDDRKVYDAVKGDFRCVLEFIKKVEENATCLPN